jgi:hypothetical protein
MRWFYINPTNSVEWKNEKKEVKNISTLGFVERVVIHDHA